MNGGMRSILKMTWRSIRSFFGRYIALLLIVMLSSGFFAGLKITQDAMYNTAENYINNQSLYDFMLVSTLGFDEEDVERLDEIASVRSAEGCKSAEALIEAKNSADAYKLISIPEEINLPSLKSGRMPQTDGECLADAEIFTESDIGSTISISEENDETVKEALSQNEFTIVGLADLPQYLGGDRGTTSIGSGTLSGFFCIPENNFTGDVYSEVYLTLDETAEIYSDSYDNLIDEKCDEMSGVCQSITEENYMELLSELHLTADIAAESGIPEPESYVLTRNENAGYISFENDASIISGIANILPLFFILIAMLVCITTMTRMVDEERTQIGTLKAMGFSDNSVTAKYLLYAGSATVIGWAAGFFLCTWGLPKIFWFAYNSIYDFAPVEYLFSPQLAAITLAVSLIAVLASTWFSCRKELASKPANLIRPEPPKGGKRILLERFTFIWAKLPFLQKVSLRNMFRYKQRLIMMLIGIGCCTALVVTAFGVRDSMINIGSLQYEGIQQYDAEASFESEKGTDVINQLSVDFGNENYITAYSCRVDVSAESTMKSVRLMSFKSNECLDFWNLKDDEKEIQLPKNGEAIINPKIADKTGVLIGDTLEVRNSDMQSISVKVSGIFENYADNYIIVSPDTIINEWDSCEFNTVFIRTDKSCDEILNTDGIVSVSSLKDSKENVDNALSCLNYIIWLIVLFSGALVFIVIYNLTNINIAERSREIATVQVLGFYPRETNSYVLRENLILSVIAGILGLPLGTLFHRIVMSKVTIDIMSFPVKITPLSYMLALVCTVVFAVIVNLFMRRHINRIHMAESLKAVE